MGRRNPRGQMRRSFVVSLSVHLAILAVLLGPLGARGGGPATGLVYEVSLVSLPQELPGPLGAPAGGDKPPDATVATAESRPQPKRDAPKPEVTELERKKTPERKSESDGGKSKSKGAADSAGTGATLHSLVTGPPGAQGGGGAGLGGFSSQLQIDIENFEFSYYLVAVRNKVSSNWSPPAGIAAAGASARTVVFFRILRNGRISDLKTETPSRANLFDQSALRAVLKSEPFPPLPRGFAESSLGVHFGFEYAR
ncbi:MAG: TonB family protein [Candidatus Eisenbacteria bacterium]